MRIAGILAAAAAIALGIAAPATAQTTTLQPGQVAPDWTLNDVRTGEPVTLSGLRGKRVLLDFWATWCGPCHHVMREFVAPLWERFGGRSDDWVLVSLGVPWDGDAAQSQRQFADDNGYSWRFVHDPTNEVAEAYGVEGIPSLILIGPDGRVEGTNRGALDALLNALGAREDPPRHSPENPEEHAQPLPAQGTVEGQIARGGEGVYRFTAENAGNHVFQTRGEGDFDSVLQLFGEDGTWLAESDDVGVSLDSRIEISLESGQTVYAVVRSYDDAPGRFGLVIAPPGTDPPAVPGRR